MRHNVLLSRSLCLLAGVRPTITNPSSLRTRRLVVVDGVEETRTMDGERVKQVTPIAGGEAETAVVVDGEAEDGARPVMSLARVMVVDGDPPARTTSPIRPSRLRRRRPPIPTLRSRPHQITPGVHLTTLGARLTTTGAHLTTLGTRLITSGVRPMTHGAHPAGAPQTTLGRPQMKLHRPPTQIPARGMEWNGGVASRPAVGRVGVIRRIPRPPLVCTRPEEAGELPLRLSPRPSVLPKVPIPNLTYHISSLPWLLCLE